MRFHELFSEAINKTGWSKNYISQTFNINRGTLYKYISGDLFVPKDVFLMLLEKMKIGRAEQDELFEKYFFEYFGSKKINRLRYIQKALSELDENCLPIKDFDGSYDDSFDGQKIRCLNSKKDIIACLRYVLKKAGESEIVTNYRYFDKEVDDAVFQFLSENKKLNIQHLLVFDKESNSLNNLNNIFGSIRWLRHQINPIYCYAYKDVVDFIPFPYYFAVDSYCLLFSFKNGCGIYIKDKNVFDDINNSADRFIKKSRPLAVFPNSIIDMKNEVLRQVNGTLESAWCMYPCLSIVADEEFISSVVRRELPDYELLVKVCVQHYKSLKSGNQKNYFSARGLQMFAKTGRVSEAPAAFLNNAPVEQRLRFFYKLKTLINEGRLMILDDSLFQMPYMVSVSLFGSAVQILGEFADIPDELKCAGNYIITLEDRVLESDILDFGEYPCSNRFFYSAYAAESYVDSLILFCEQIKQ